MEYFANKLPRELEEVEVFNLCGFERIKLLLDIGSDPLVFSNNFFIRHYNAGVAANLVPGYFNFFFRQFFTINDIGDEECVSYLGEGKRFCGIAEHG